MARKESAGLGDDQGLREELEALKAKIVSAASADTLPQVQLVIIESPYAGDVEANVVYARAAMRDSLNRDEAPIASHLLYTQPGILRDEVPEERQWGIDAGLAWREVADFAAFYTDRGWSAGMLAARETYEREGRPFVERSIAIAMETGTAIDAEGGVVTKP